LTEAELRLMHVLWRVRRATVAMVLAALRGHPPLAYNTVLTTLRILEHKKYVTHLRNGRAFVYRARVSEDQARHRAIQHLLDRLFNGSPSELVATLLGNGAVDRLEFVRIRGLVMNQGGVLSASVSESSCAST
jgi:predicted transcriptional regulator